MTEKKAHSEQFFGDTRDFWWNRDFIELMARRWDLSRTRKVLDVGCGRGHWGQELGHVLPPEAQLIGIDPESQSIALAAQRAADRGLSGRYRYQLGRAEKLDFADDTFDLVTCQTVLIHVPDPILVLREMIRVLAPGGLLVAVEPNNQANAMALDSLELPLEDHLEAVRFSTRCERGKKKLGLGFNSLGCRLPGYFAELELKNIQVHLSDKAIPLFPPYATREQQALKTELIHWAEQGIYLWDREETLKYFLADGGTLPEFDRLWSQAGKIKNRVKDQLSAHRYSAGGGALTYLTSGRKTETRRDT